MRETPNAHERTRIDSEKEVYSLTGAAMEVLNELGHGLWEKTYENALMVECRLRGIPVQQQVQFDILYKNEKVGLYIPDIIAYDAIVVETKTVERLTNHERGQILNYLRISGLRVGLLLNFKYAKLEWERIVL